MFDGTLDKYTGSDYTIELQEIAKPYRAKPRYAFLYPTFPRNTRKKEFDRLTKIGVFNVKYNNFQWSATTFIIPKKNCTVIFISDFN